MNDCIVLKNQKIFFSDYCENKVKLNVKIFFLKLVLRKPIFMDQS